MEGQEIGGSVEGIFIRKKPSSALKLNEIRYMWLWARASRVKFSPKAGGPHGCWRFFFALQLLPWLRKCNAIPTSLF